MLHAGSANFQDCVPSLHQQELIVCQSNVYVLKFNMNDTCVVK